MSGADSEIFNRGGCAIVVMVCVIWNYNLPMSLCDWLGTHVSL